MIEKFARGNYTHTPVAGETVELGIVAGTEPARADNHMHPRYTSP
jgi:hypothetical protein